MTSLVSSADAGSAAASAPGSRWQTWLILVAAMLVVMSVSIDFAAEDSFGWDVRVNCLAVDAHAAGVDPYFVRNLKDTKLSYPYLPVTLDAFRPLCAGGYLVAHYKAIYLVLALICALLLPALGTARRGWRDTVLRAAIVLGGFLGFDWVVATGNFEILGGLLTAAALALLLRPAQSAERGDASLAPQLAGAAVLGLVTAFKLVFLPILAALYFLPHPRRRKLLLIAVAAAAFALPIAISLAFYPDLFRSWISAITGQIPGQHSPASEVNQSLLLLASSLAGSIGLAGSKPIVIGLYALIAVTLVLAPFAVSVWRMFRRQAGTGKTALLSAFDDWLVHHPAAAMRITVLAMYALYLCTPRPKEYTFFQVALYAAVLIADLPAALMVAALAVAVFIPILASASVTAFMGGYGQLTLALICFWILLPRAPQRA
ncbi:glycosyltransferase 87 family protein [Bradyrhizobium stylosanthis]|uniref:glycosyltransferase 87 family protein n=1 Tax=Bradyrhizobium stylosanthis TaxID=1803665 RepID=UPI0007C5D6F9|nr:glycosyltransferase 87 family protein [Bradyrhizobium stylosanthis]